MKRRLLPPSLATVIGLILGVALGLAPRPAAAQLSQTESETPPSEGATAPSPAPPLPPPTSAAMALDRAAAAYEYGDLAQVLESARPVAEGAYPGTTEEQRARALRFLGIGLYLSGWTDGAETAFVKLLELRPRARLDPATARPEVLAFFEDVRRRHGKRPSLLLGFLPPLGQLQNGDVGRAWLFGGLELASLAGALGSLAWLETTKGDDKTHGRRPNLARAVRAAHFASWGVFAAAYAAGVADALLRRDRADAEPEARATLLLFPNGAALRMTF
jgi:hypothetical protein